MGSDKLWIDFWGRPAWRWSLDTLLGSRAIERAAVVVPPGREDAFEQRLPRNDAHRCLVVEGAETRAGSVRAGLAALSRAGVASETLVLVHDAARPALSPELIAAVAEAARERAAAAPIVRVADTLKRVADRMVGPTVGREGLGAAQTPQAASLGLLMAALDAARARGEEPTDEASALAGIAVPVVAVDGDPLNCKLTELGDEALLRAILRHRAIGSLVGPGRAMDGPVGIGFDAHRLVDGVPLRLGGVDYPSEPRGLAGHSDGDVAMHAVVDAILGAAHLGDIGRIFPSSDERWHGADSRTLARMAMDQVRAEGWRVATIDVTVVATRPAIAPRRAEMEAAIAVAVGAEPGDVSVKGTTSDGLGFGGEEGIAAYAVASLRRDNARG